MWPFGSDPVERVQEVFSEHPVLKDQKLSLAFRKGTLTVTGRVPREAHKNVIEGVAMGVSDVKEVDVSGVQVEQEASTSAPKVSPITPSQQSSTPQVRPINTSAASKAPEASKSAAKEVSKPAASKPMLGSLVMDALKDDPAKKAVELQQKVAAHPALANNPLDIFTRADVVIVRGAVDSEAELANVQNLAKAVGASNLDVSGVRIVKDVKKLLNKDEAGDVYHEIKSGDTLSEIALKYYGDGSREMYMKLAEANDIADPNKIYVGQKIIIPGTPSGPNAS